MRVNGELAGCVVAFFDSTEREQAEEELRQSEKLAALGKLSAGLAHELNNPAAAAQRASSQLRDTLERLSVAAVQLGEQGLTTEQWAGLARAVEVDAATSATLSALERADREEELAGWLGSHNVDNAWQLAPPLVAAGIEGSTLEEVTAGMPGSAVPSAVAWLSESLTAGELLGTLTTTTTSMSELVGAVKSYSYMDQAAQQEVDIHEGLESTLRILRHKLGDNVEIVRDFDPQIPEFSVLAGELNQVWTNLLDNAIDAVGSEGGITLRTALDGDHALVEICDDGPGVPVEIQSRIFDPFFTTKEVGQGTGLGLDVVRRIVTDRSGGSIEVHSEPGDTRFQVRLPLAGPPELGAQQEGA